MSRWPKWVKVTFIVSGCLFVLAALATVSLFGLKLSAAPPTAVPTFDRKKR